MAWLTIEDDLGDTLTLERRPERIVSLVPSITETVIALGAAERLVGITSYCVEPAEAVARIAKVGGTKGFHLDRIEALAPDLVVANKEENRKHHIDALREHYPVFVTYPRTLEDAIKMVGDLGALTGESNAAARIIADYGRAIAALDAEAVAVRLRTACMIWRDPWMAAGPDTYMSRLLERFGFENIFEDGGGRYPETTLETIAGRRAELVILPSEPYEFGDRDRDEVQSFFTSRGHDVRVIRMDGSYLTWFGVRTVAAVGYLGAAKVALV